MNRLKSIIFFVLSISISANTFAQSPDNFDDVLKEKTVGKVITKKYKQDISEKTYLGLITNDQGKLQYYVVKDILRVKAAIVYH